MTSVSGDKHAAGLTVCDQLRVKMDSLDAAAKDEKVNAEKISQLCKDIHQLATQGKKEGIGELPRNIQVIRAKIDARTNQVRELVKRNLPEPGAVSEKEFSPLEMAVNNMEVANEDFDDAAVKDIVRKMESTETKAAKASKRVIPAGGLVIGGCAVIISAACAGFVLGMTGIVTAPFFPLIILGLMALGGMGIIAGFAFGGRTVMTMDPDAVKSSAAAIKELSQEDPDLLKRVLLVKQHNFLGVQSLSDEKRADFLQENRQFIYDLMTVYKRMKGDARLPKDFDAKTQKLEEMIETLCTNPVVAESDKDIQNVRGSLGYLESNMWTQMNFGRPDLLVGDVENLLKSVPKPK